jgi:hypothetical protein
MKKILGDELLFVGNGDDTLLPAGTGQIADSASKLTDAVFAPSFLDLTNNVVQAGAVPILSFGVASTFLTTPQGSAYMSASAGSAANNGIAHGSSVIDPTANAFAGNSAAATQKADAGPVAPAVGAMTIHLIYDAAAMAAPQSFRDGMQTAANLLMAAFNDNITINIAVGYGEYPAFNGQPGQSLPNQNTSLGGPWGSSLTYSTLRQDLINTASSTDDNTSVASLANASSLQGHSSFFVANAQLKAFGVSTSGAADGGVGMGTGFTGNVLIAGALHEITHAMGRTFGSSLDVFRFNEDHSGNRVFGGAIPSTPAYFSINGGSTNLADFGINSDPGDFLNRGVQGSNDPFNENVGNLASLTAVDLTIMDVLGFHRVSSPPAISVSINDMTISEGDGGTKVMTFTVTRSGGTAAFAVNYATADGTATTADHDYAANSGTLNFGSGVNTQTISITINGDTKLEPSETFFVNLSGATNGTTISDSQGIGTIQNDELNRAPRDFNTDGTSDVFWRNNSNGHVGTWEMHNNVQTWHDLGFSGVDFKVAGIGDFNGDGTADLFWRNDSDGHVGIWEMQNNVQTWHDLGLSSATIVKVAGIGDFNGDRTADVLWRNDSDGHVGIWEMHNNVQTWHDLGLSSATVVKVAGIGDFNGDGTSDIFWRNDSDGHVGIWEMHNNVQTWHDLGLSSGTDFKVAGIGDFNGDHTADILWRNDSNGHVGIWEMHNNVQTWHDLGFSGTDFKVAGIGDYNGDGTSDIFWRNNSDGHVGIWEMHNNVQTWHDLGLSSGVDHSFIV